MVICVRGLQEAWSVYLDVRIMVAGVGGDVVRVVVVLPPLHASSQEERHKDAHDGVGAARCEELVVPHVVPHQSQLHARTELSNVESRACSVIASQAPKDWLSWRRV